MELDCFKAQGNSLHTEYLWWHCPFTGGVSLLIMDDRLGNCPLFSYNTVLGVSMNRIGATPNDLLIGPDAFQPKVDEYLQTILN